VNAAYESHSSAITAAPRDEITREASVLKRWQGPLVVLIILSCVVLFLLFSLNPQAWNRGTAQPPGASPALPAAGPKVQFPGAVAPGKRPADFREYPIGEEVERNQMRIAAVWLPAIQMDGMPGPASAAMIHIEADIHATEGNRNGCAKDEFIPYLTVRYTIESDDARVKPFEPIAGTMMPMVARDGWHYGASVEMPKAGRYKLTYAIGPPSAGRHSDPVTGVAPWWQPFNVVFDWDYPGPAPKP
jgi:uncharacterized protein involved in high-affinity Fe2+ transport